MTDKLQIQIPEGYKIDTFDLKTGLVTFKKKSSEQWRNKYYVNIEGFFLEPYSIQPYKADVRTAKDKLVFPTKKQALSVYAFSELSKIIANDPRFGGPITDEEWKDSKQTKYIIIRKNNCIESDYLYSYYAFLAFHTEAQRDLFLKENEDLIRQYFML